MSWLAALTVMPSAWGAPGGETPAHPMTDEVDLHSLLSRPAAKLRMAQVLQGQFRHSRHLREIPQPLVALGEFTFVRDLGVYWHTRQPFDSVIVLTNAGLAQSDDGGPVQRISADEQPAVRLITSIFMALFTLDTRTLGRHFHISGAVNDRNRWFIGLKPRADGIAGAFSQATVAGADEVEQIVLTDAQGDRTVIDLTGIRYSSDVPGAEVRALFAPPRP